MHGAKKVLKIHDVFSKVGIVGCGNMMEAFLRGVGPLLDPKKFVVASPSLCAGTRSTSYPVAKNNRDAVRGAKLVIYGAKPKDFKSIFEEIAPVLGKDVVVISMAAGKSILEMQDYCGMAKRYMRIMPNTPVKEKLGVIALTHTPNIPDNMLKIITGMLETVGYVVPLSNEEEMDIFTGLFGSGPAYFFLILEYLETIADKHGLMANDKPLRRKCLIQLMKGSSVLLENSELAFEAARRQVTSPNGTTHAAVTSFENSGLLNLLMTGVDAAAARSKEMGQPPVMPTNVSQVSLFKTGAPKADQDSVVLDASKKFGT